jgi:hypothetical protein
MPGQTFATLSNVPSRPKRFGKEGASGSQESLCFTEVRLRHGPVTEQPFRERWFLDASQLFESSIACLAMPSGTLAIIAANIAIEGRL